MITQTIDLSMTPEVAILPEVFCSQYDNGIRQVVFNLFTDAELTTPYDVSGLNAIVEGTKPDGNAYAVDAEASGSSVTVTITTQMAAVAGLTPSEIVLTDGTVRIGSFNFMLMVEPAGILDEAVVSDSAIPAYVNSAKASAAAAAASQTAAADSASAAAASQTAAADSASAAAASQTAAAASQTEAAGSASAAAASQTAAAGSASAAAASQTEAAGSASAAADSDESAEAWANGTRNGSPVGSGDPAYHNNAKYWKDQTARATLDALDDVEIDDQTVAEGEPLVYGVAGKWINGPVITPISRGGTGNTEGYIQTGLANGVTIGTRATSEGINTEATGSYSHAEGRETKAGGFAAHAEGNGTTATGNASHAEGFRTTALGFASHVGGYTGTAKFVAEFLQGVLNEASTKSYKFDGVMPGLTGGFAFGFSPHHRADPIDSLNESSDFSADLTFGGGCAATLSETAKATLTLHPGAMYLLFCSSFTVSNGAIFGATARLITCLPTNDGTPNNVVLGTTTNAPATIAFAANQIMTIQNAAAARATQFSLIRVA